SNESLLSGFNQDLLQVRDLLVWSADGANTSEDLNAMANNLVALRDSLFYTANSRDQEGRFVFSGTLSNTATIAYNPAAAAGSRYTWQGNTEQQLVAVGNDVRQPANVTLGEAAALLNALDTAMGQISTLGASPNDPVVRAAVGAALDGTDVAINAVSTKIGRLGGAQNIIDTLDGNHRNVSLANQQAIIDFGHLDYSDAAVRLNGLTSAIQATQKAYGKVSQLSLFDVL
ncbi:MAG TPA: flagellar hook-associated protein 3, partial [Rhizobacter sp.]|nr:flagellar hook-associated protein 3 [Rhizobacter sp.]